jgi:signal transduction histidine kinase
MVKFVKATSCALVLINKTQFCRIVFNLALNSRDAMPDGGTITLRLASVKTKDADDNFLHYILLEVTDTGVGMDTATQQRIGEPYFTTKPNGTGLGLAIVMKNLERAGGLLRIESEPGRGSTFRVFLPRVGSSTGDTMEFPIPDLI